MGTELASIVERWLMKFEHALSRRDRPAIEGLFFEEACWRDLVALAWDTRQFWGREKVVKALLASAENGSPQSLAIDPDRTQPRYADGHGERWLEAFFLFRTQVGTAQGFVKLGDDGSGQFRAQLLATQLMSLDCAKEKPAKERHARLGFDPVRPGQTYGEYRAAKGAFADCDPDVLVVGGGHAGVSIGARLERMGMSYLVIDKRARPGDVWRQRYESLALHTVTEVNDLPYMPVPDHFPRYMAKDKWADWIEMYVKAMELNYWPATEFLDGRFDEEAGDWTVSIQLASGQTRTMRPKHVVLAVGGIGGKPRVPELPGLRDFRGLTLHSSAYRTGEAFRGKHVLVVGASTSGHDIALDLVHKGANSVSMAQRGPSCVVHISEAEALNVDYGTAEMTREEADLRRNFNAQVPFMVKRLQAYTKQVEESHAGLYEGLRRAGMKLTQGADNTGWVGKLVRDLAGYYLNVGCSEAIVDGRVRIIQMEEIDCFVPDGVLLKDASVRHLDTVILATGYESLSSEVEALLGHDISMRVGRSIGIGEDGEPRNLCRPTGQPHLWLIFGGIIDARKSSGLLAMQIKAQLEGLVPSLIRKADGSVAAVEHASATA